MPVPKHWRHWSGRYWTILLRIVERICNRALHKWRMVQGIMLCLSRVLNYKQRSREGVRICMNLRFPIAFVVIIIRLPSLLVIFGIVVTITIFIKCQCLASTHPFLSSGSAKSVCILPAFNLLTLSKSERVDFSAPSGRPKGKQYLKEINPFKNWSNITHLRYNK